MILLLVGEMTAPSGGVLLKYLLDSLYLRMRHTCRWPLCDPLYPPPLKIFFGFTPPLGDQKEGWLSGLKIGKIGKRGLES